MLFVLCFFVQLIQDAKFAMHSYFLWPQYSAEDSSRIMVSSADSRIRIIQGLNVMQKYKGMHLSVLVCC